MIKGVKIRFEIHNILYEIYKFNKNLSDNKFERSINKYDERDISFINNVCLNTMRYQIHINKIINKFVKRKPNVNERILLSSAITQIVYLDFKLYAVINCSVELAKKLNIYHGFINSCLKKISSNKDELKKKVSVNFKDLPSWFINLTKDLTNNQKNTFLINYYKEPSLHLVFKNELSAFNFEKDIYKTSNSSGFLKEKQRVENIPSYKKGNWWVQDFASFLSLSNHSPKKSTTKYIDLCSAPGGKAFQILSKNKNITLNDKNKSRIKILKKNLDRLNFKAKTLNIDVMDIEEKNKYDFIVLDAPCSAIGTIRKNPEIFFKQKKPNLKNLLKLQEEMLIKSALLLRNNGTILYMVCSFFKAETFNQINKFLNTNKNFYLDKFPINNKNEKINKFVKNNYLYILPSDVDGFKIDGYFAVYLKKAK